MVLNVHANKIFYLYFPIAFDKALLSRGRSIEKLFLPGKGYFASKSKGW